MEMEVGKVRFLSIADSFAGLRVLILLPLPRILCVRLQCHRSALPIEFTLERYKLELVWTLEHSPVFCLLLYLVDSYSYLTTRIAISWKIPVPNEHGNQQAKYRSPPLEQLHLAVAPFYPEPQPLASGAVCNVPLRPGKARR